MEGEEKEEMTKILETLTTKIDELTNAIKEKKVVTEDKTKVVTEDKTKVVTEDKTKEVLKEETKILETLTTKIDELTKTVKEKKIITEDKIKENPLAYIIGAFTGGLVIGLLIGKREEGKE